MYKTTCSCMGSGGIVYYRILLPSHGGGLYYPCVCVSVYRRWVGWAGCLGWINIP